jgi:hypothetical protein
MPEILTAVNRHSPRARVSSWHRLPKAGQRMRYPDESTAAWGWALMLALWVCLILVLR